MYLAESESGWRDNIAGLGYFEGFPAGVYDVTVKTPDGRTLAYKGVTVVAGQVTDLSTYTPVITYSAELGWSWSSPLTVAPTSTGGFTVERTYQIDRLAAGSDFTISYYYSTSQWGNNPTLLGSETVTAAEGKIVGVHSGVSPEFKITTPGTYYVFARIDTENQLAENNEDDNMSVTVKLTI
jgi:hypothetical protein